MNTKRSFNIAYVTAELKAKLAINRFTKEYENNGNQNQRGSNPQAGQGVNAQGNVPQQPQYGG